MRGNVVSAAPCYLECTGQTTAIQPEAHNLIQKTRVLLPSRGVRGVGSQKICLMNIALVFSTPGNGDLADPCKQANFSHFPALERNAGKLTF